MRILAAKRRAGSPRFTPRKLIRLAPTSSGALDLCFGNLRQVPFEELILMAVVMPLIERKPVLSLVLILRDQPRPFMVAAKDVDFEAFESEEDTLEASVRVLLGNLGDRHSDLLISSETAAFLRGTPVPKVQEVELANFSTSWLAALDPSLAAEHPLLPEIEKPSESPSTSQSPDESEPSSKPPDESPETPPTTTSDLPPLGPLSPGLPPPLLPPFGPSLVYGTERLETISRGLGEALPKVVYSAQRRAILMLTALGTIIPCLLYLGAIGTLGHAAYRYASRGTRLLEVSDQGERLWSIGDLAFVIPMAACLLFLLTLLEPLFVRRPKPPSPRSLERARNTVLFSFVERLARTVGASLPKVIEVTTDADLGLHRQSRRQGGRLVLTLGLPLLAGVTLEQFAALLTRELTAFIRRPENRLFRFIQWVDDRFDQLFADCTDLQEKRRSGVGQLVGRAGLTPLVDVLLFLVFGLTRTLIALLAHMTTFLRRLAEAELAKDAASYQDRLVGKQVANTAESWADALRDAQRNVVLGFDESRLEASPPPDHLPAQVVLSALEEKPLSDEEESSAPSPPGAPPRFRSTLPATVLFQDFGNQARRLTSDFYRGLERPRFTLEPFQGFLEEQTHLALEQQAALRFFGGALLTRRALPVAATLPQDQRELKQKIASLHAARQKFNAALPNYLHLLTQFDRAAGYRTAAREANLLMSAGLTLEPQEFGLEQWTPEAARTVEKTAVAHLRQAQALLKDQEMRAGRRLMSVFALLSHPEEAAALGFAEWAPRASLLLSSLTAVNRLFPVLSKLSDQSSLILALEERSRSADGAERQRLDELLILETQKLEAPLSNLREALLQEKDLFHLRGSDLNLAIEGIPQNLGGAAGDVVRRVHRHYRRCLARLAWMAEKLEQKVGLPPQAEVDPLKESRPWKF